MLVDKFIEFLKKMEKEHKSLLGDEYRKECFFTKDTVGFYLAGIPKDKLEKFLKNIEYEGFQRGQDEIIRITRNTFRREGKVGWLQDEKEK